MKKKDSFKTRIREYMESKTYDLQEELRVREVEVKNILFSDTMNWPRIQKLAEQANVFLNEWALLNELIGLKKKKIAKEFDEPPF